MIASPVISRAGALFRRAVGSQPHGGTRLREGQPGARDLSPAASPSSQAFLHARFGAVRPSALSDDCASARGPQKPLLSASESWSFGPAPARRALARFPRRFEPVSLARFRIPACGATTRLMRIHPASQQGRAPICRESERHNTSRRRISGSAGLPEAGRASEACVWGSRLQFILCFR